MRVVRGRLAVVPVLGLALAGVVVPGAWADSGTVDRRVHRPHIVSPQATLPTEGTPVELTGHFNDPVSPECRIIPSFVGAELPPQSEAEAGCRQAFVVTSFTAVGS